MNLFSDTHFISSFQFDFAGSSLIAQSENVASWLTPVWMLCVGLTAGLVIVAILWMLLLALAKVGGLNTLYDDVRTRRISSTVASLICFAVLFGVTYMRGYWSQGDMANADFTRHLVLMIIFYSVFSFVAGFGFIAAVSKKRTSEIKSAPTDGFLYWTNIVGIVTASFAILAFVLSFFGIVLIQEPNRLMQSLRELPSTGEFRETFTLDHPSPENGQEISSVQFRGDQWRWLRFKSDQPIWIATQPITPELSKRVYLEIQANEDEYQLYPKTESDIRFAKDHVDQLFFVNRGNAPANVTVKWLTEPRNPQVILIPWAAGSVIIFYMMYFAFVAAMPKVYAVAQSTFKTEISQPVFIILAGIGILFAVGSIYIPYNTFGEDIKMYKDSGLTLIRVLGIFLAVWAASKSVAEEIEGRTALTVLSKPVGRRQFILGKYSGIAMSIGLLFIIVGIWFLVWVAYKPIYDSGESTVRDFTWQNCYRESVNTIPGLVLAYMESLIFAAISVVISTRMGILANFMICFAIYVLGHLTPLIVQSAEVAQSFEGVVVFGQIISIIFPVLDHFDIHAAINSDVSVPIEYLGWSTIYCFLYGFIALLLALVLFEDRDLA